MDSYEEKALRELKLWQIKMTKRPSLAGRMTKPVQTKINGLIPDVLQHTITFGVKNMVKAVLYGSDFMAKKSALRAASLEEREKLVAEKLAFYKKAAATTGAGTGAGGIILGLADFPLLLGLKIKFLFDAALIYGYDVNDFQERLYILYLFELTFSSQERRCEVFKVLLNWNKNLKNCPPTMETFDWRSFQQEYRDYIDIAKLLQLVPGIGAVVGALANYKLVDKLGETAKNGYRMRLFS
ncbi:EcsC family protein [Desulfosporosinus sp. PR]|uniref:EcsC family protein n=1 Tax=Candidatus Desulfosporosinus nitrosoreducens TaxID=3401928 RepID=UPI0027F14ECB|nr:EcsC family protein [Desulfosporosinus sp. PR]MDQ7092839.1 EcsC family protein [Desulfosporosinus sp. PR]